MERYRNQRLSTLYDSLLLWSGVGIRGWKVRGERNHRFIPSRNLPHAYLYTPGNEEEECLLLESRNAR